MKRTICLCISLMLISLTLTAGCPESCTCNDGIMQCRGLRDFINRTDIPANITSVIYEQCFLEEISVPLMYTDILKLKICDSNLTSIIEGAFQEMIALTILDLSNNTLSSLTTSVFSGLQSLQDLNLSHNLLSTLPDGIFSDLPSLTLVDLSGNMPFHFTSSMFMNASSNLQTVSCVRCNIGNLSSVVEALSSINGLVNLNLGSNPINSLPSYAFRILSNLKELNLNGCSINSLNETSFFGLKDLSKLILSHNKIENLPSNLFQDSQNSTKSIFLDNNLLRSLDEKLLPWSILKELYLENNPWNCDCALHWIQRDDFNDVIRDKATCAEPASVQGLSIWTYPVACEDKGSSIVVLAIVIPIIIICLAVIGCFLYRVIQTMVSRKRHAREKSSFRYSAVYKETVEPAAGGMKQKTLTGQNYRQDSHV